MKMSRPLLFDLQALLHWAEDEVPEAVIQRVEEGHMVYVSALTLWEFILKEKRKPFNISYQQLLQTVHLLQAEVLPIKEVHLEKLHGMRVVQEHHDPFDRLLVAQALQENLILVGADRMFPAYRKAFHLQILWKD